MRKTWKSTKRRETNWSYWCINLSKRAGRAVPADTPETPLSLTLRIRSFWDQWSFWMEAEHREMCLKLVHKVLTVLVTLKTIWNHYENSDSQYCLVSDMTLHFKQSSHRELNSNFLCTNSFFKLLLLKKVNIHCKNLKYRYKKGKKPTLFFSKDLHKQMSTSIGTLKVKNLVQDISRRPITELLCFYIRKRHTMKFC